MIDCPVPIPAATLAAAGIPAPEAVLHTHVQTEHCREGDAYPDATIHVPQGTAPLAANTPAYREAIRTVWPPDRPWSGETMGMETWTIAGCAVGRPPEPPLKVAGELVPGDTFTWRGLELDVVALPGHDRRAIGLHWREGNTLFCGDLMHAGGTVANFHDLDHAYGSPLGRKALRESLARARALGAARWLPSTGPAIENPDADADNLLSRLDFEAAVPVRRAGERSAGAAGLARRVEGRLKELGDGVWQNSQFGNIVLFIDAEGRGMMFDPGPCVWPAWTDANTAMREDLDWLEREAGLRRVERAYITHFHGDHVDQADYLRERYGTEIVATPDVADVMERPGAYRYPCGIDWYGSFDSVRVDRRVLYGADDDWHGVPVRPVHTPGHCFAHAGYVIRWRGRTVAVAGDVFQYAGGPIRVDPPCFWNDAPWPDAGARVTYERLAAFKPDWILGGHSHAAADPDGSVLRDFIEAAAVVEAEAARLAANGDLRRATTAPGYPARRPPLLRLS
jgi:glyoxylase-like metal-dependent hydrolase (beta-lactamase superfamily II)